MLVHKNANGTVLKINGGNICIWGEYIFQYEKACRKSIVKPRNDVASYFELGRTWE